MFIENISKLIDSFDIAIFFSENSRSKCRKDRKIKELEPMEVKKIRGKTAVTIRLSFFKQYIP